MAPVALLQVSHHDFKILCLNDLKLMAPATPTQSKSSDADPSSRNQKMTAEDGIRRKKMVQRAGLKGAIKRNAVSTKLCANSCTVIMLRPVFVKYGWEM